MRLANDLSPTVRVKFTGPDKAGRMTTKSFVVFESNVDEVKAICMKAIEFQSGKGTKR